MKAAGRGDARTWRAEVLLDAVAVKNEAVREADRDGMLVLHVPIRKTWYNVPPFSWVMPYRPERGFAMDQLGAWVWQHCDGEQTIEHMIEAFAAKHKLRFHEARLAITSFLQSMVERGIVVLVFPQDIVDSTGRESVSSAEEPAP